MVLSHKPAAGIHVLGRGIGLAGDAQLELWELVRDQRERLEQLEQALARYHPTHVQDGRPVLRFADGEKTVVYWILNVEQAAAESLRRESLAHCLDGLIDVGADRHQVAHFGQNMVLIIAVDLAAPVTSQPPQRSRPVHPGS